MTARCPCSRLLKGRELSYSGAGNKAAFRRRLRNSRVFAGYFITVTLGEDEEITGEDSGSLVAALWRLARNVSARGLRLRCAGMSGQWRESALSQNTGWGYFGPHQQPMHMMDLTPEGGGPDTIDEMIREAVGAMKIGLTENAAVRHS